MSKFIKMCLLLLSFFNSYNLVYSQPTTWQRIFGSPRNDYAYDFFQTIDGNYFMLGENQ